MVCSVSLHRGERAQHRLLAALALFSRGLVVARLRRELAVEQLLVVELGLHALAGGFARGQPCVQV